MTTLGTVDYKSKTVSDAAIKTVLENIADKLNCNVTVTSGDRVSVVKGSSSKSLHIQKRAADFYVSTHSLEEAYKKIKEKQSEIFDSSQRYQVILHGAHTNTGGRHLHVGRYKSGVGVKFCTEGDTKENAGKYSCKSVTVSLRSDNGAEVYANRSKLDDESHVG